MSYTWVHSATSSTTSNGKSANSEPLYSGEDAFHTLMEQVYRYHSKEDKEKLEQLGQRLSAEGLLHSLTVRKLIDLFERCSDEEETLDDLITSLKFQGTLL